CSPRGSPRVPRRTVADPIVRQFGVAVREARTQRGETLEQVAHRIPRMDAKYLGEIERGWHAPSIPTAKRVADALGVTLAQLVRGL
ncbi:MAG TPA: helix-turn-helix transcriptional regulator, partial [Gaiellaceae bacterium]|nr:helix-turn-helix transcriptional regulator [Gaiellaceae bacterium]